MTTLFTAEIITGGQVTAYNVFFENDQYVFSPEEEAGQQPRFSAYREHDEWKIRGELEDIAKHQALAQLESYLLSQH